MLKFPKIHTQAIILTFPLIMSQAPAHLGLYPQVCTRLPLLPEGEPTGKEELVPHRGPGLPPFGSGTTLNPNLWNKVGSYSLLTTTAAPHVPCHPMALPFTPTTPHPRTHGPGRLSSQDIFHFLHFFINQMIQNNHHSLNAQAPSWFLLPWSHPP